MAQHEKEISLYIIDNFFKDIFFTQLAIIKEDELFEDLTIIGPLKLFLRKAFILHLTYKVFCLANPNLDNHHM